MGYFLVHHDLVDVDVDVVVGSDAKAFFWLRYFEPSPPNSSWPVIVITDVPRNPHVISLNAEDHVDCIVRSVAARLHLRIDELVVFTVTPRNQSYSGKTETKRVELEPFRRMTVSRADIESMLKITLPELPQHTELCARVKTLGGGRPHELDVIRFEAVPVGMLPPPHDLFKCAHKDRFGRFVNASPGVKRDEQFRIQIGDQFFSSLTEEDLSVCIYHAADWKAIAKESVRIIEDEPIDESPYLSKVRSWAMNPTDRKWLESLFMEPISLSSDQLDNGQHRSCALRFSGADTVAVATNVEKVSCGCQDWIYEGDG
ncbi:MAG: hypothetical protein ACYCPT_10625 [Acidimicrobiales bacterium]